MGEAQDLFAVWKQGNLIIGVEGVDDRPWEAMLGAQRVEEEQERVRLQWFEWWLGGAAFTRMWDVRGETHAPEDRGLH